MIIKPDSLLYQLPIGIEQREILLLDAIRFIIEMIDYDWECLNNILLEHSKVDRPKKVYKIFNHTWSILDNAQRLKVFCKQFQSLSGHKFLEPFKKVNSFRNTFQHLSERIDYPLISSRSPFFGSLTWEYLNDETKSVECFLAISGIYYGDVAPVTFSEYILSEEKIQNILLESVNRTSKDSININELINGVAGVLKAIEDSVRAVCIDEVLILHDWEMQRDIVVRLINEKPL